MLFLFHFCTAMPVEPGFGSLEQWLVNQIEVLLRFRSAGGGEIRGQSKQ